MDRIYAGRMPQTWKVPETFRNWKFQELCLRWWTRLRCRKAVTCHQRAAFHDVVFEGRKGGVVIICVMVPDQAAALRSKFAWITS